MKINTRWAAVLVLSALAGSAQAALTDLGNGTVLDSSTNLIWLKNWNVNGVQDWYTQNTWAETGLDGFAGSNNWHLPSLQQFIDLFAAYGNLTSNTLPFTNVAGPGERYWTGTDANGGIDAFNFRVDNGGYGGVLGKTFVGQFAVAVQSVSVPEPQSLALVLLALGSLALATRRLPGKRGETPTTAVG